jgi:hypothetical protein
MHCRRIFDNFSKIFENYLRFLEYPPSAITSLHWMWVWMGVGGDASICTAGHVVLIDAQLSSTPSLRELSLLNMSLFEYRGFPGSAWY